MPDHTTLNVNVKLSEEQLAELKKAADALPVVRKQLDTLKKLGMDVSEIEDKLKWADQVQTALRKEFS